MATLEEEMDRRYTDQMGRLVAEAEKRAVAAEVKSDYWAQQHASAQQELQVLREELAAIRLDASEKQEADTA